jgi:hypothetical protein
LLLPALQWPDGLNPIHEVSAFSLPVLLQCDIEDNLRQKPLPSTNDLRASARRRRGECACILRPQVD